MANGQIVSNDYENNNDLTESYKVNKISKLLTTSLAILFSLFYLYTARFGVISPQLNRGVYVGGTFVLILLTYPISKTNRKMKWLDYILILLTVTTIVYFITQFSQITYRAGNNSLWDTIFGITIILMSLEATRRVTGNILTLIAGSFLLYNFLGPYLPSIISHPGISVSRVTGFMFTSLSGVFGSVAQIFSNFVFLFIIFGTFLEKSGAANFFIDFPYTITGKTRGGPAKAAVLASGLMGSISGSAVANVVTTGTFTIPLMKKTGYKPHIAAAIETAASSGGQLVPPIMGAGAFIIAEFTGISYKDIIIVSLFPAFLYFLSVFVMVDIQAAKHGLKGLPKSELPSPKKVFLQGWQFLIPIIILLIILLMGNSTTLAALGATISTVIVSWFRKDTRMGVPEILDALKSASFKSLIVGATVGSIGIIIGTVYLTGIGLKFSNLILSLSHGLIPLAIILVAIASYILGMGLTVTSSYVILAVLAAPALTELGIGLLPAHLIVFWLSQDANVTPPVCLAAFASAGIAGADPMKTGWSSLKFAKGLYIIPFLMAYTPILLNGTTNEIVLTFITSIIGIVLFSIALQGYWSKNLNILERVLLFVTSIMFFVSHWKINLASLVIMILYLISKKIIHYYRKKN